MGSDVCTSGRVIFVARSGSWRFVGGRTWEDFKGVSELLWRDEYLSCDETMYCWYDGSSDHGQAGGEWEVGLRGIYR